MLFFSSLLVKCVDGILKISFSWFQHSETSSVNIVRCVYSFLPLCLSYGHRSLLYHVESFVVARGLSSCGMHNSVSAALGLSCSMTCGILVLRPGIEPTSPGFQGRFFTTGPPGKPQYPGMYISSVNEKWKSLSHVWLFVTSWTVACQAPLSMEFSRQEYWSGLPFPSPGDLPNPGIKTRSPALQVDYFSSDANICQ